LCPIQNKNYTQTLVVITFIAVQNLPGNKQVAQIHVDKSIHVWTFLMLPLQPKLRFCNFPMKYTYFIRQMNRENAYSVIGIRRTQNMQITKHAIPHNLCVMLTRVLINCFESVCICGQILSLSMSPSTLLSTLSTCQHASIARPQDMYIFSKSSTFCQPGRNPSYILFVLHSHHFLRSQVTQPCRISNCKK
jgi:hypothetical protein